MHRDFQVLGQVTFKDPMAPLVTFVLLPKWKPIGFIVFLNTLLNIPVTATQVRKFTRPIITAENILKLNFKKDKIYE